MLEETLKKLYHKAFKPHWRYIEKEIRGCHSLLDLGCGYPSPVSNFSYKLHTVGVDAFGPSIAKSKADHIHDEYVQTDVLEAHKHFRKKSFDCVIALDLIEHLDKNSGFKLIEEMETLARKKVVIFTPNGFLSQPAHGGNRHQKHLSGWSVDEMRNRGYKVIGINGWKPLRKEFADLRFNPHWLWLAVSDLTQLVVQYFPKQAFAILCVKTL